MNSNIEKEIFTADLKFNLTTGEVFAINNKGRDPARLSPVNRRVLSTLLAAGGAVVSRTDLFDTVWPNQEISDDALTRSVADLRAQLKPLTQISPLISTVPKVGYRWLPPITTKPKKSIHTNHLKNHLMPIFSALSLLVMLLLALMYFWISKAQSGVTKVIILPADNNAEIEVVQCLKQATRSYNEIQYLSNHAYESHSGNPYPFFALEFGVRWFIESSLTEGEANKQLILNLVDARTGMVLIAESNRLMKNAEISIYCDAFIGGLTDS